MVRDVGRLSQGYALASPPSPALAPPPPAERAFLAAELTAEPRGAARDALACTLALTLEPRSNFFGLTQCVHEVVTWLLRGNVGRALRRLDTAGIDQRALLRDAVPFVSLGLLVGITCVDGHVHGATNHGGAVLWRLQNTAHAAAMRYGIATPETRRMLKPQRHDVPLLAREPAAEVFALALRYAVEASCGLDVHDNLARLLKTPGRALRPSLHEALHKDCLLPMAQAALQRHEK